MPDVQTPLVSSNLLIFRYLRWRRPGRAGAWL